MRPANKVALLFGNGPRANCVELNVEEAAMTCDLKTPKLEELTACTSAEEVADLDEPEESSDVTFPGSAFFLPAPFLRDAIIAAETMEPFELILVAYAAAADFDRTHADDASFVDQAMSHAEDIILWAWGVGKGKVTETRYFVRPNDGEFEAFCNERHRLCILPTLNEPAPESSQSNAAVLAQLTRSISRQTEEAETANLLRREELQRLKENDGIKKDKTKKIHSSILNMIKMASSTDGDRAAIDLVESCRAFMNSENTGMADQELNLQFEDLGQGDVGFTHGLVQNLHSGNFFYNDASTPSNFSAFSFYEQLPLQCEQKSRYLMLHLIATQGQGKTVSEIKASARQEVKAPMDFNSLGL